MNDPNRNARWGRAIAEELSRGGVGHVVLCPGSRNTPLLFPLATTFGRRTHSHVDERSAGFLAIGLIRATNRPAAVCVTSGSALANLLPAVCEADAAGLPLIILSADRPWEQHHCGAPQTMPQRGILAPFVRHQVDLGEPDDGERCLLALRRNISAVAQMTDGPCHINVPLRDPLPPLADPGWNPTAATQAATVGRDGPFTTRIAATGRVDLPELPWLHPGRQGIIVAGCAAHRDPDAVLAAATALGFPILADAASGLRQPHPLVICHHDALVDTALGGIQPDLIIQVGQGPLTRAAIAWQQRATCPQVVIARGQKDHLGTAWLAVDGDAEAGLTALQSRLGPGDPAWAQRWRDADDRVRAALGAALDDHPWSEPAVVAAALATAGHHHVHLASSMSIRHANLVSCPDRRPVHANRGVNGIDGTVGTFIGLCRGFERPGLLIVGDLALLHDLPALAAADGCQGTILVINNGGGGIFDHLAVAQVDTYRTWVRTDHRFRFAGAAAMFGLDYAVCQERAGLDRILSMPAKGLRLVECILPGTDTARQNSMIYGRCRVI